MANSRGVFLSSTGAIQRVKEIYFTEQQSPWAIGLFFPNKDVLSEALLISGSDLSSSSFLFGRFHAGPTQIAGLTAPAVY